MIAHLYEKPLKELFLERDIVTVSFFRTGNEELRYMAEISVHLTPRALVRSGSDDE